MVKTKVIFTLTSILTTLNFLLPTSYYLLLTTYFLLPTSYFLLLTSYFLLPTSYFLLLTLFTFHFCLVTFVFYLKLLPTSYYLLLFSLCSYVVVPLCRYLLPLPSAIMSFNEYYIPVFGLMAVGGLNREIQTSIVELHSRFRTLLCLMIYNSCQIFCLWYSFHHYFHFLQQVIFRYQSEVIR